MASNIDLPLEGVRELFQQADEAHNEGSAVQDFDATASIEAVTGASSSKKNVSKKIRGHCRKALADLHAGYRTKVSDWINFIHYAPLSMILYRSTAYITDPAPAGQLAPFKNGISNSDGARFQDSVCGYTYGTHTLDEVCAEPLVERHLPQPVFNLFRYISNQPNCDDIMKSSIASWIDGHSGKEVEELRDMMRAVMMIGSNQNIQVTGILYIDDAFRTLKEGLIIASDLYRARLAELEGQPGQIRELTSDWHAFTVRIQEASELLRETATMSERLGRAYSTVEFMHRHDEPSHSFLGIEQLERWGRYVDKHRLDFRLAYDRDVRDGEKMRLLYENLAHLNLGLFRLRVHFGEDGGVLNEYIARARIYQRELGKCIQWNLDVERWFVQEISKVTHPDLSTSKSTSGIPQEDRRHTDEELLAFIEGESAVAASKKKSKGKGKKRQTVSNPVAAASVSSPEIASNSKPKAAPKPPTLLEKIGSLRSQNSRMKDVQELYGSALLLTKQPMRIPDVIGLMLLAHFGVENALKCRLGSFAGYGLLSTHHIYLLVHAFNDLDPGSVHAVSSLEGLELDIRSIGQPGHNADTLTERARFPRNTAQALLRALASHGVDGAAALPPAAVISSFMQDLLRYGMLAPLKDLLGDIVIDLPTISLEGFELPEGTPADQRNIELLRLCRDHFKSRLDSEEEDYLLKSTYFQLFCYFNHFLLENKLFYLVSNHGLSAEALDAKSQHRLLDLLGDTTAQLTDEERQLLTIGPQLLQILRYPHTSRSMSHGSHLFRQTKEQFQHLLKEATVTTVSRVSTHADTLADLTDTLLNKLEN